MTCITRTLLGWISIATFAVAGDTVTLFNGKNLDGWTFDIIDPEVKPEQIWSVADGILVCKGRPPGVIRTEREFENYEITVEWRWPAGGEPGNGGLLVHCSTPRERFIWPKSLEVQLAHENAGDFWMIGEKVTVLGATPQDRRWVKRQNSVEKPVGEWNTMRVRCEGNRITVWVNGVLMNEGTDITTSKGAICLQSEGAEIHFRKVELTPIE
ncbi:MAG: 3-keto-disaccharide hydrolase [Luteolibacter sp.]